MTIQQSWINSQTLDPIEVSDVIVKRPGKTDINGKPDSLKADMKSTVDLIAVFPINVELPRKNDIRRQPDSDSALISIKILECFSALNM